MKERVTIVRDDHGDKSKRARCSCFICLTGRGRPMTGASAPRALDRESIVRKHVYRFGRGATSSRAFLQNVSMSRAGAEFKSFLWPPGIFSGGMAIAVVQ